MKKGLLLLPFLGLVLSAAIAQATIEIHPNPSNLAVPSPGTGDKVAHAKIKHLVNETKMYKWTRDIIEITSNCQTQVCDRKACYTFSVGTRNMELTSLEDTTMDVHIQNPTDPTTVCCGIIHILVEEINNPSNNTTGVYTFTNSSCVSSTLSEAELAEIKVFPNPLTSSFSIENAQNVHLVQVFGLDGRVRKQFISPQNSTYSIEELESGHYVIVLKDEFGALLGARGVTKM